MKLQSLGTWSLNVPLPIKLYFVSFHASTEQILLYNIIIIDLRSQI